MCSAYYAQPIPLTHFDTLNLILEFDETVENQFGQQSVSAMKQDKPLKGEYETHNFSKKTKLNWKNGDERIVTERGGR